MAKASLDIFCPFTYNCLLLPKRFIINFSNNVIKHFSSATVNDLPICKDCTIVTRINIHPNASFLLLLCLLKTSFRGLWKFINQHHLDYCSVLIYFLQYCIVDNHNKLGKIFNL